MDEIWYENNKIPEKSGIKVEIEDIKGKIEKVIVLGSGFKKENSRIILGWIFVKRWRFIDETCELLDFDNTLPTILKENNNE